MDKEYKWEDFKVGMWIKLVKGLDESESCDWYNPKSYQVLEKVYNPNPGYPDGETYETNPEAFAECLTVVDFHEGDEEPGTMTDLHYTHCVPDWRKMNLDKLLGS